MNAYLKAAKIPIDNNYGTPATKFTKTTYASGS